MMRKKIFTLVALLTICDLYAAAYTEFTVYSYSSQITYLPVSANEVKVTKCVYYLSDLLVIPSEVENEGTTYTVKSIDANAAKDQTQFTSAILPRTLTAIGDNAFKGCTGLTVIDVHAPTPPTVGTDALTDNMNIYVPATAVSAYRNATGWNSHSTKIAALQYDFFNNNNYYKITDATNHTVGITCRNDSYNSYSSSPSLFSPVTENGTDYELTSILDNAFRGCTDINSVEITPSITSIGANAFYGCSSTNFQTVYIPPSVTSIGANAFHGCSSLIEVIAEKLAAPTLGADAFSGCAGTLKLYVPANSLAAYKSAWIAYASIINALSYDFTYQYLCYHVTDADNHLVEVTYDNLKGSNGGGYRNIPENPVHEGITYTTTAIGDMAFKGYSDVTPILPSTLTSIGAQAFYGVNYGLTHISIPANVTSIGNEAFSGCSGLGLVVVGNGSNIPTLGTEAFKDCYTGIHFYLRDGSGTQANLDHLTNAEGWKNYATTANTAFAFTKKVIDNQIVTLYLPYNTTIPMGLAAYYCTGINKTTGLLTLAMLSSDIPANLPIIMKNTGDASETVYDLLQTPDAVPAKTDNKILRGTAADIANETDKYLTLGYDSEHNYGFFTFTGAKIKANTCYILASDLDGAGAKTFGMDFSGATTSIETLPVLNHPATDAVYDLQGRRILHPAHGIYIKNGKLTMMK